VPAILALVVGGQLLSERAKRAREPASSASPPRAARRAV
jgi:hypothetical protein